MVILTLFPGDPFDYGAGDDGNAEGLKNTATPTKERGNKQSRRRCRHLPAKSRSEADKDPPLVIDEERLPRRRWPAFLVSRPSNMSSGRRGDGRGERGRPC